MTAERGGRQPGTDALIRQVDRRLAVVRAAARPLETQLAERLAATLRVLVAATAGSSAATNQMPAMTASRTPSRNSAAKGRSRRIS